MIAGHEGEDYFLYKHLTTFFLTDEVEVFYRK